MINNAGQQFNIGVGSSGNTIVGESNFFIFDQTADVERVVVTTTGDVGIGTKAPNETLTVGYNSGTSSPLSGTTNAAGVDVYMLSNAQAYIDALTSGRSGSTQLNLRTYDDGTYNNGISIASTGDVGIGTTNPDSTLAVDGGVAIGTTYAGSDAAGSNNLIVQGDVGIGTASPTAGAQMEVYNATTSGSVYGVYGVATGSTGGIGVYGSGGDYGVEGVANATTGTTYGVYGSDASANGAGGYFTNSSTTTTGTTYGVYGSDASSTGAGGYFTNSGSGYALITGSGGVNIGGAESLPQGGGELLITTTTNIYGIYLTNTDSYGVGVYSQVSGSDAAVGVEGVVGYDGESGSIGVQGYNASTTGSGYGVYGYGYYGVYGYSSEDGCYGYLGYPGYSAVGNCGTSFSSDRRLKKDIEPITGGLATILKLKPVSYLWKEGSKNHHLVTDKKDIAQNFGFIAQDVEKVLPQLVNHMPSMQPQIGPNGKPLPETQEQKDTPKDGYLMLDYNGLIAPTVEAVQELYAKWLGDHDELVSDHAELVSDHAELAALKAENDDLKKQVAALRASVQAMRNSSRTH
ncbi:MAG TPA: tail fiber domain-containing protein [Stellaceae bacterium]|nr:tail fiber domain-containing protein [Stellaceae bacterium]